MKKTEKKKELAKVMRETKQLNKEFMKEVNVELKELSKLKGDEFQKSVIGHLRDLYKGILDNMNSTVLECMKIMDWTKEQDEGVCKFFGGLHNNVDKGIGILDDRLHFLQGFTLFQAIRNSNHIEGRPMSYKRKKNLASMLSIDWDGSVKEFMKYLKDQGPEALKQFKV